MDALTPSTPLYDIPLTMIDGSEASFAQFKGQTVLVVNVASKCGLTPQYRILEELQEKYASRDFTVLGLPCNQFKGQEPGSEEEIQTFCSTTFGVTFPMTSKVEVNGSERHPLYAALTEFHTGDLQDDITWNFEKFLISDDGRILARFAPRTEPDAPEVIDAIEAALGK